MGIKKNLNYYLNLMWSFTIEQDCHEGGNFYIIRVNELPGICTDAESIEEGMKDIKEAIKAAIKLYLKQGDPIPEPIDKNAFKGNIAYRTTSDRHYQLAKMAKQAHKSLNKTLDMLVDTGLQQFMMNSCSNKPRIQHPK